MNYQLLKIYFLQLSISLVLLLFVACNKQDAIEQNILEKDTLDINSSKTLTDLGNEQWRLGNYQEALKFLSDAYNKVKKSEDKVQMATLLNSLGLVHWRLENNDAAMECYTEAAQLAEQLNMNRLLGLTHTNKALILKEKRVFDEAFYHNNKAIKIFKQLGDSRDLAIAYNNQGQIYRFQGREDAALNYYNFSLEECKKIGYKEGMATAYQNLSTLYAQSGKREEAFNAARKGLSLSLQVDSKVRISEAYMELSKNHEIFSRPDSALYYYKKHYEYEKNILEANQSEQLSKHQASLGLEVKNLRIENLQKEKQIANNRMWFIAVWIIISLLIVAFFIYRYFSKMRSKKRELEMELQNSQEIINIKELELKTYIIDLSKKNAVISRLKEGKREASINPENDLEVAQLLEQKILTDEDWEKFKTRFDAIYPDFFSRIKNSSMPLTEAEIRIMVLMRLELAGKDMANILGISPQSVRVCKMRLKKKLLKDNYDTVEDFLHYLIQ